ncbi:alpha-1,2-mannosidase, putative subfamily [Mycena albidolilacea]|uniref:Alpha-1,2-mannosidase, putative subfamily n=1 Tax=Mycena albidolilacea TaxID=1033008 RepID=A0AAD7A8C3_9AGAR|nr:alpha-1,2-mannosidase, putative subfamily [Mycena albidolilacea]
MKAKHIAALSAVILLIPVSAQDPAQFVNPFIGTKSGGHVFPGATLPWGSVKAGADSRSNDNQAGYVSDGTPITGISSLHDDGTGGGKSLGNFPFLPLTSTECADNDLTKCNVERQSRAIDHGDPTASPGYFSIPLKNGVKAEVTVTQHTALHRFTYQPDTEQLLFLLDVTGDLGGSFHTEEGHVTVSPNPTTKGTRVTGSGTFIPSFGQSFYRLFFCFDASATFEQAKYYETSGGMKYTDLDGTTTFDKSISRNGVAGVLMGFAPGTAHAFSARMGISWISTEKACAYAEEEIPDISAFDTVHTAARTKWNNVLGTIEVDATGVSAETQELFWSSLYRTYIAPTNVTGDNPLWNSSEPYWDSFYCIWDTFRVVHPLYAITAPTAQAEVIRALIDIYRNTGWLPDCRMSMDKGFTQGGSNADSLLADSFIKGIKAGIDWEEGFKAMVKDATVMGDFEVEGRGSINSRERLGFVPVGDNDHPPSRGANTRSASRLLEYAYNDFDIALVAQGLNKTAEMVHYFNKSADWYNIWNPDAEHSGFKGFIQPRSRDGSWFFDRADAGKVFRPDHCSPVYGHNECFGGYGGGEFYEASSWEYSFYVPHDMASVVDVMGGPETFSSRLDHFFEADFHDMGDEPGFLPTYLYNYVGKPVKTVDRVDAMIAKYYSTAVDGLAGNDDSGSMGAYAVWSHLGFYPVAGQDTYLLNRPYFPKITIRNEVTGSAAIIIASGLSAQNKYIQSATLNGKPYTKNWISHDLFRYGGTLKFVMGSNTNSTWGTGPGDLPASLSTGGFGCDTCISPAKLRELSSIGTSSASSASATPSQNPAVHDDVAAGVDGASDEVSKPSGFLSYLIFLLLAD